MTGKASGVAYEIAGAIGAQLARQAAEAVASRVWRAISQPRGEQQAERVIQIQNVFVDQPKGLAEKRQDFQFAVLNHTLKQSEWTFRLSVGFMAGGAAIVLTGAALALVHAGKPDRNYVPLVTGLTGVFTGGVGGALALHSKRAKADLLKAAEDNEKKIDTDRNHEAAMAFIDRVEDPQTRDRLNSAAALKALGMEAQPEMMANRLLPDQQPKQIEPGDSAG
ncbi:hypothetical protein [Streptomyces sp. 1-11]|uniref:TRADD-N-associated membrane domain-containing protein n=1 Tax=Streptomyces sp. 1-11 TaxID=2590549 RepID=UPI00116C9C8D|nr:hypothetical protein [Streptomyces sp. 1-11]GEK00072.1 hypothetical protein TNCT1_23480 [Streptomyces sp. 1-11]